jgi:hypothetical protein
MQPIWLRRTDKVFQTEQPSMISENALFAGSAKKSFFSAQRLRRAGNITTSSWLKRAGSPIQIRFVIEKECIHRWQVL